MFAGHLFSICADLEVQTCRWAASSAQAVLCDDAASLHFQVCTFGSNGGAVPMVRAPYGAR